MDDNHLRRQALALDPTIAVPVRQQGKTALYDGYPLRPATISPPADHLGARVSRVFLGFNKDGEPEYMDHYFAGGSE